MISDKYLNILCERRWNPRDFCETCAHKHSRPNSNCDSCITGPEYAKPSNYEHWIDYSNANMTTGLDIVNHVNCNCSTKEDKIMDFRDRIYVSVDGKRFDVINGSISQRPGEKVVLNVECVEKSLTPYDTYCKGKFDKNKTTSRDCGYGKFAIKKVIFNDPATIVLWEDGTKTVVKCENEDFDPEKGLSMAFTKKVLGNKGHYFETVKKWTRDWYVENIRKNTAQTCNELAKSFAEGFEEVMITYVKTPIDDDVIEPKFKPIFKDDEV